MFMWPVKYIVTEMPEKYIILRSQSGKQLNLFSFYHKLQCTVYTFCIHQQIAETTFKIKSVNQQTTHN